MQTALPNPAQIAQLPMTYETKVSDEWIDVMGHMNVAYYTASFSKAMQSARSSWGLDNETVKANHIGTFAIETHTRYVTENRVGDRLQIFTRVLDRSKSKKRLHAMHFMVNVEHDRLSATFEAIVANVDLQARRMAPMLPDVLANLDETVKTHRQLSWAAPVCGAMSC